MYDMYHWHRIDPAADDSARHTSATSGESTAFAATAPAVQAVQAALDRRDNGGDLAATRGE